MIKNKKNFMVKVLLVCLVLSICNVALASGVLVSKAKLYPSYVKTPQDIEDWLIKEGFYYKSDEIDEDEWKSPEQVVKDKGNDCEDYVNLTAYILEDLGYKEVKRIALFGKNFAHGICCFKKKDGTWSYFSVTGDENSISFYHDVRLSGIVEIVYTDFPEWNYMSVVTEKGRIIKATYRKRLKGVKK